MFKCSLCIDTLYYGETTTEDIALPSTTIEEALSVMHSKLTTARRAYSMGAIGGYTAKLIWEGILIVLIVATSPLVEEEVNGIDGIPDDKLKEIGVTRKELMTSNLDDPKLSKWLKEVMGGRKSTTISIKNQPLEDSREQITNWLKENGYDSTQD